MSELAKELVLKISEVMPHVGSNPTASASMYKKGDNYIPFFSFLMRGIFLNNFYGFYDRAQNINSHLVSENI